jgi:hypothetical protein
MYKSNISPVHFLTLLFNIHAKTVSCAQIQYQPYVLFNPVSSNILEKPVQEQIQYQRPVYIV